MTTVFPFNAVVGHDDAKLALLLAAVEPAIGGVLLRGQKGSAKSTLARGLAAVLPGAAPFVELPVGATEDRVVGSIDLAAALTAGDLRFRPGLLAAADAGVLYVDEVNLLPDHLVDVLLDVAASGVNRVEREGISHSHPSRFVLIGSMNPEEGDLRPQLLDRFGLSVDVTSASDPDERAEAVRRRLDFDAGPGDFCLAWASEQDAVRKRVAEAQAFGPAVAPVSPGLLRAVSALCAAVGAEGLRADLVICRAASALARLDGRDEPTGEDVRRVAPLALGHRRRRQPFEPPGIPPEELDEALHEAMAASESTPPPDRPGDRDGDGGDGPTERTAGADSPTAVVRLEAPRGRGAGDGRRSKIEGARGHMVASREPGRHEPVGSVALGATVTAAATRRAVVGAGREVALVEPGDLREAVREQRAGNLVILTVDASGSMGADTRMEAAKGAVLSLLLDAYQRRDRVALVTFRGDSAEVALKPTSSVEVARARLGELPTGGRTPLAAGITAAIDVASAAMARTDARHRPLIVLVSDGRATASATGTDPVEAALESAAAVRRRSIGAVVIDVEDGPTRLGLAAQLAEAMGGRYLRLSDLSAGSLENAVRLCRQTTG